MSKNEDLTTSEQLFVGGYSLLQAAERQPASQQTNNKKQPIVTRSYQFVSSAFLSPPWETAACYNLHNQKANAKRTQTQTTTQNTTPKKKLC
jgi:hypothetical protein